MLKQERKRPATKSSATRVIARLVPSIALVAVSTAYALWQHAVQSAANPARGQISEQGVAGRLASAQAITQDGTILQQNALRPAEQPQAMQLFARPSRAARDTDPNRPPGDVREIPSVGPAANAPPADAASSSSDVGEVPQQDAAASAVPAPVASAASGSAVAPVRYADGDYTGDAADTVWGSVQVKVAIRNGSVAQVDPFDYPTHRRRSADINSWAVPILMNETIQAQSAQVDLVSQATATSYGYQQSLASALAQARK